MAVYYASKAFVLSLSEALSFELSDLGVAVTTLCPGPTKSKFQERAKMPSSYVKDLMMGDASKCARRGLDGLFSGRDLVIDGWVNRVSVVLMNITPRRLLRWVSARLLSS